MIWRIPLVALLAALTGACAFGNTINYGSQVPVLELKTEQDVVVGVQDQRPYVVSGRNTKQFVGLQRAGFGNPYGVHTESGKALADEFADAITQALEQEGATVQSVVIPANFADKAVLDALFGAPGGKYLLVQYKEWKSDTYVNVALIYNVTAKVYDKNGTLLAENKITGQENLGGDFVDPASHAAKAVPEAFREKLEELLGHQDIRAALK